MEMQVNDLQVNDLSERQENILKFIMDVLNQTSIPPTIREIGTAVDISSTSVVNYNLSKLKEQDLIFRDKEKSRGLALNWNTLIQRGLTFGFTPPIEMGLIQIPVLGRIAAGEPIHVPDPSMPNNPDSWVGIAEGMFGSADDLFALEVKGDSMIDASVLDGDIVILRHQEEANNGDMVAAWIEGDDETTLKYLHKEGRRIRLQPANPSYEPIYRDAEKVRIAGKVVSVIRVYHKM